MPASNQLIVDQGPKVVLSIDAMGGDLGPSVVLDGLKIAAHKFTNLHFIVHGPEHDLTALVTARNLGEYCTIRDAQGVVEMTDKPSQVVRHGKDTSMWSAINAVKSKEAEVCVSCGNTGALMAVSMIRLRKMPGVNRPAIAILWPANGDKDFNVMLDVGADIKADENDLLQYALMGVSYCRNGFNIKRPKVGLLNVGTEDHKGRAELRIAHDLIRDMADDAKFEFVGFVEGGDIPSAHVDVIVTDGFTGNVALKTAEGTATFIGNALKSAFYHSILSRLAAVLAFSSLRRLRKKIDPRRANGGVFLGLNGTVVKSHGAADATGVAAAVGLAYRLSQAKFSAKLAARVASASGYVDENE